LTSIGVRTYLSNTTQK